MRRIIRSILAIVIAIGVIPGESLRAQSNTKQNKAAADAGPKLTLEAISRDPGKWMGTPPSQVRWTEDGGKLHFNWNPERGDRADLYELDVRASGAKPRKVANDEKRWLSSNNGDRNKAKTLKVWSFAGDIFLHDIRSAKTRQITLTADSESNPRFTADGRGITYTRSDNLYEWVIETGETRQLTDIRKGKDPDEKLKLSKQDEYLEKQQLDLFEILQKQEKNEKEQKERTKEERGPFPDDVYLKENESVGALQLSPDRKHITFVLTDRGDATKNKVPEMPKYVTKSGYTENERLATQIQGTGRVKVGAAQPSQKLGVMDAATGKVRYVDMGLEKREHTIQGGVQWSEDGSRAFTVLRSRDNRDRWIALVDVAAAKSKLIDTEHDDAWIGVHGPYGWLADNETIWFRSERSGFLHVYTLGTADGSKPKALTSSKWEVTDVDLSDDKSKFYITASEPHPGERQLYTLPVGGGQLARLTTGEGVHNATLSPDEKWIAVMFASPDAFNDLYLMQNAPGAKLARLTDSYTDEFKSYKWRKFEIVTIPDADGHLLYARLYKPDKPHAAKPAVIYVHGAGYAQSVFKNWGSANWQPIIHVLAQEGYTVLDLDYRGSAGYGRDCRTSIYRNMGGKDIDSAVVAAKWLATAHGIDPRRIGIFGGSYGGFFTLMAQFKHPGVFAAGGALYPVTDWAHYNHPYTSNILNLPAEDDEAYKRSSPIYHAAGLQDRLLILHGMFDRNVHYQDTIRLTQRLIELKKSGWELATLPVEDHGWQNEFSRLDSNRRLLGLFDEVLKRPLPAITKGQKTAAAKSSSTSGK